MSTTQELISVATAAQELGITPSAVRSAIAYGSLRATPIDRRTNMIERSEVERYRQENLGQRGKRPRTTNPPRYQAYQRAYHQLRKAARQQQPATEPAESE